MQNAQHCTQQMLNLGIRSAVCFYLNVTDQRQHGFCFLDYDNCGLYRDLRSERLWSRVARLSQWLKTQSREVRNKTRNVESSAEAAAVLATEKYYFVRMKGHIQNNADFVQKMHREYIHRHLLGRITQWYCRLKWRPSGNSIDDNYAVYLLTLTQT